MKPEKNASEKAFLKNEDTDRIDEKLERLQKQNEAETIALKKLLHGLEKIKTPPPAEQKLIKKKPKKKRD